MNDKVAEVELTYKPKIREKRKVMNAQDAYNIIRSTYREGTISHRECFKVLFLNNAHCALGYTLISEGGITETNADIRIIMQATLLTNSTAIILSHNHPSGNTTPSSADKKLTEEIIRAAEFFHVKVLDHIILSDEDYFSFSDNGLI